MLFRKAVCLGHLRFGANKSEDLIKQPELKLFLQPKSTDIFLIFVFLQENICCGYSLELP